MLFSFNVEKILIIYLLQLKYFERNLINTISVLKYLNKLPVDVATVLTLSFRKTISDYIVYSRFIFLNYHHIVYKPQNLISLEH